MVENYGSDVSRKQFEIMREDLEKAKKATRPGKVELYDVFCADLYVLKTGCQWRNLPKDFPNCEKCLLLSNLSFLFFYLI